MIFDRLFGRIFGRKKEEEKEKPKCTELHTKEEYKKAVLDAMNSAKKEIIIITDDFSEFR